MFPERSGNKWLQFQAVDAVAVHEQRPSDNRDPAPKSGANSENCPRDRLRCELRRVFSVISSSEKTEKIKFREENVLRNVPEHHQISTNQKLQRFQTGEWKGNRHDINSFKLFWECSGNRFKALAFLENVASNLSALDLPPLQTLR